MSSTEYVDYLAMAPGLGDDGGWDLSFEFGITLLVKHDSRYREERQFDHLTFITKERPQLKSRRYSCTDLPMHVKMSHMRSRQPRQNAKMMSGNGKHIAVVKCCQIPSFGKKQSKTC